MMVWVLQENHLQSAICNVFLYQEEHDALKAASLTILNVMHKESMHNPTHVMHNNYLTIKSNIDKRTVKGYLNALAEYDTIWLNLSRKNTVAINVSLMGVIAPTVDKSAIMQQTTQQSTIYKKIYVPCRVCGAKVSEGESYCWKCGIKDPIED